MKKKQDVANMAELKNHVRSMCNSGRKFYIIDYIGGGYDDIEYYTNYSESLRKFELGFNHMTKKEKNALNENNNYFLTQYNIKEVGFELLCDYVEYEYDGDVKKLTISDILQNITRFNNSGIIKKTYMDYVIKKNMEG